MRSACCLLILLAVCVFPQITLATYISASPPYVLTALSGDYALKYLNAAWITDANDKYVEPVYRSGAAHKDYLASLDDDPNALHILTIPLSAGPDIHLRKKDKVLADGNYFLNLDFGSKAVRGNLWNDIIIKEFKLKNTINDDLAEIKVVQNGVGAPEPTVITLLVIGAFVALRQKRR